MLFLTDGRLVLYSTGSFVCVFLLLQDDAREQLGPLNFAIGRRYRRSKSGPDKGFTFARKAPGAVCTKHKHLACSAGRDAIWLAAALLFGIKRTKLFAIAWGIAV